MMCWAKMHACHVCGRGAGSVVPANPSLLGPARMRTPVRCQPDFLRARAMPARQLPLLGFALTGPELQGTADRLRAFFGRPVIEENVMVLRPGQDAADCVCAKTVQHWPSRASSKPVAVKRTPVTKGGA